MSNLHESPGYQKLLHAIIDSFERKGVWPKTKKLTALTEREVNELRLALRADCITVPSEDVAVVNVDRILQREFNNDRLLMEATFATRAGRTIRARRAAFEAERHALDSWLATMQVPAATSLLEDLRANTGWISAELRANGEAVARSRAQDFLRLTNALPLNPPRRLRTYARELGFPSKALDRGTSLHRRLLQYLTRDTDDPEEAPEEALTRAGLATNMTSIHALIDGNLSLQVAGTPLQLPHVPAHPSLLTWEILQNATPRESHPRAAIFIENETSFNEARSHRHPDDILVFTEGVPNRAVLHLAKILAPTTTIYHWGDIDAGGFRALRMLRTTAPATAIHMDASTLHDNSTESLDEAKARAIAQEIGHWQPGPERDTLEACLQLHCWLEQETIPASAALATIRRVETRPKVPPS